MRKNRNKAASMVLVLLLVFGISLMGAPAAKAAPTPQVSIDVGSPGSGGAGHTVTGNVITLDGSGGTSVYELTGTTTTNTVIVTAGADIILNGVDIRLTGYGSGTIALDIRTTSEVRIWLADGSSNVLKADTGIKVESGQSIVINGDTGQLDATGDSGAGIGGRGNSNGNGFDGGSITINGGIINATGSDGAGIGGGRGNPAFGFWGGSGGVVTINGGTVTATSVGGAGIGGGECGPGTGGAGGTIIISGGTVNASATYAPGIGAGSSFTTGGAGASVTITGGTVVANGGGWSAGIGGSGTGGQGTDGTVGTSVITGGNVRISSPVSSLEPPFGNGSAPVYLADITITDGSTALQDVTFNLGGYNAQSDSNGKIHAWLPAGVQNVSFSKTGYTTQSENFTVANPGPTVLNVTMSAIIPPAIIAQPSNQSATPGSTAVFSVGATGTALVYQWEESTDGGTTWANVSTGTGGTTATYTTDPTAIGDSGKQYRCVVTNSAGTATSAAAILTVTSAPTPTPTPTPAPTSPAGNSGNGTTVNKTYVLSQMPSSSNAYTAICNASYGKLTGVYVDNSLLSSNQYTAWEGSTYVQLNAEYINTLSPGTHTLTLHFTDGSASDSFTVSGQSGISGIYVFPYEGEALPVYTPSVTPSVQTISDETVEEGTIEQEITDNDGSDDSVGESNEENLPDSSEDEIANVPATGDTSANVVLILTLTAVVGLAGLIFVRKRMVG